MERRTLVRIRIKVHGHSVSLMPEKRDEFEVHLEEPTTIRSVLRDRVGVNPLIFGAVVVGGKTRHLDYVLEDDAEILLVSPVAGG